MDSLGISFANMNLIGATYEFVHFTTTTQLPLKAWNEQTTVVMHDRNLRNILISLLLPLSGRKDTILWPTIRPEIVVKLYDTKKSLILY